MAWIIDKDLLAEAGDKPGTNSNAVGVFGPRGFNGDQTRLVHRFRLKDDDGEVVYEGRCDSNDDENAFGPLDDFGMPNAGCTTIEYWTPGKGGGWEQL